MPEEKPIKVPLDERVALPLDPETALRALLQVDPDAPPVDEARPAEDTPNRD